MKALMLPFTVLFLSGCATTSAPLTKVDVLPDNSLRISSEAPMNSSVGSTALLGAEAANRCANNYRVLSRSKVNEDDVERSELIVECIEPVDTETAQNAEPAGPTGNKGNETVRLAQLRLNEFGYDAGYADGILGVDTKYALELFQSESGLEVTGRLDKKTQQALKIL